MSFFRHTHFLSVCVRIRGFLARGVILNGESVFENVAFKSSRNEKSQRSVAEILPVDQNRPIDGLGRSSGRGRAR